MTAAVPGLPVGISATDLVTLYPRVFHLTHVDNWNLIQRLGLRSTSSLLDLFGINGDGRAAIECHNRRDFVRIQSETIGSAILRDQKPMDDKGLRRALTDGLTPGDWYRLVNRHVFFWVDRGRVDRLLGAQAYRRDRHLLLTVDTAGLVQRHRDQVVLSPLNTGATKPMPHPRGADCFVPRSLYPFDYWRLKRRGRDAIVELAIPGAVPDLMTVLQTVSIVGRGESEICIWPITG